MDMVEIACKIMEKKMYKKLMIMVMILSFCFGGCSNSSIEYMMDDYLSKHTQSFEIDKNEQFSHDILESSDVKNIEIFLTGECHGIKANYALKMAFLKHLKKQVKIRYLIEETSFLTSYYINQYLQSGDEKLLNEIVYMPRVPYSKDAKEYFKKLYEYNKTLDAQDKLTVIGIDYESNFYRAVKLMADIIPNTEPPEKIKEIVCELIALKESLETSFTNKYKVKEYSERVIESISKNRAEYKEYFGDNFYIFELVNKNIVDLNRIDKLSTSASRMDFLKARDQMFYDNFRILENNLPYGRYYGQLGNVHVFQDDLNGVKSFATLLNQPESKYHNKIYSVVYNYKYCQFDSNKSGSQDITYLYFEDLLGLKQKEGDFLIVDFNEETSDNEFIPMINIFTGEKLNKPVSDYFQQLVIINKSKAVEY